MKGIFIIRIYIWFLYLIYINSELNLYLILVIRQMYQL